MKELSEQEIINLAYATYDPCMEINDELSIVIKSDDGGRHLELSVDNHGAAKYLRKEVPHTFEGFRTIVRYRIEHKE